MDVGFGFFVQMTPEEAVDFCSKKIGMLESRVRHMHAKSKSIQGHIKELMVGIEQLRLASNSKCTSQAK